MGLVQQIMEECGCLFKETMPHIEKLIINQMEEAGVEKIELTKQDGIISFYLSKEFKVSNPDIIGDFIIVKAVLLAQENGRKSIKLVGDMGQIVDFQGAICFDTSKWFRPLLQILQKGCNQACLEKRFQQIAKQHKGKKLMYRCIEYSPYATEKAITRDVIINNIEMGHTVVDITCENYRDLEIGERDLERFLNHEEIVYENAYRKEIFKLL